jgi:hypothetical protein
VAETVRAEIVVEYPVGSPESYGGVTDPDSQIALERSYLEEDESDYLLSIIAADEATVKVVKVGRSSA